jgi:hypothetical protein
MRSVLIHSVNAINAQKLLIVHTVQRNYIVVFETSLFLVEIINQLYELQTFIYFLFGKFCRFQKFADFIVKVFAFQVRFGDWRRRFGVISESLRRFGLIVVVIFFQLKCDIVDVLVWPNEFHISFYLSRCWHCNCLF